MFLFMCLLIVLSAVQLFLVVSLRSKIRRIEEEMEKHARSIRAIKLLLQLVSDKSKSRHSLTSV